MKAATPSPSPSEARRALAVPLRPDPAAQREKAVQSLCRAVIATASNAFDQRALPGAVAAQRWPQDADTQALLKAAVGPLMTTSSGVENSISRVTVHFLDAIRTRSAGANLLGQGINLRFGRSAAIAIPMLGDVTADFVREGEPIPVVMPGSAPTPKLTPKKIAVIVVATFELLNCDGAEAMIRAMLADALGPALDRNLLGLQPGDDERPAGLLNGIAPLASSGDLAEDLATLISAVSVIDGEVAIIAAVGQAARINLMPRALPYVVLSSATLPPGVIVALALAGLVSASDGPPQIEAARNSVVHMETDAGPIVGQDGVARTPVMSQFQTDTTAIRLRWPISWALRSPNAIAWMTR